MVSSGLELGDTFSEGKYRCNVCVLMFAHNDRPHYRVPSGHLANRWCQPDLSSAKEHRFPCNIMSRQARRAGMGGGRWPWETHVMILLPTNLSLDDLYLHCWPLPESRSTLVIAQCWFFSWCNFFYIYFVALSCKEELSFPFPFNNL